MNPPTQWAEFSSSAFSPNTMIEQQSSFGSGLTVNRCRSSNDQLWLEVAKRYQQIIEKDIKLRYPSQPAVPIKTFHTDCSLPNPVENTQFGNSHPLPPSALPVAYQKEESLTRTARQKEIDPETFPRIIDVFSLNPSLPAKYFQDNVAVRLTPGGLIAEPVGRPRSLENVVPKQNVIPGHSFTRRAENLQEKRNHDLVDYDKKFMQDDNFQINQRADILDYIDIEASQNVTKIGSLKEGNPHAIEMHGGCGFQDNSAKEEQMCDMEAMISVNKRDVSEQIHSDVNAQSKRRKRKRRAIFGLRRNKKRHFMGNTNTVKENNQHELKLKRDGTKIDKRLQFECRSSLKEADSKSNDMSKDEKENRSEKQGQERIQDGNIQSKQDDEENTTISYASQTELKCAGTIDSQNLNDTFVPSLHGNNIRQSKILDLKAKLVKQEQQLQNLRQRKDFENVKKENCAFHARLVEDNLGKDGSALLKYETIFDFSHPIDVTFWAQNKENDDDFNLGKIEDLIHTFQKEIKSFRILDTELNPTGRGTDYDHLQSRTCVVSGNKSVFAGINNKMRLAPQDVASKEEFLLQLGLLRIQ